MPLNVVLVFNEFPALATSLPYNADRIAKHAATVLHDTAVETCPVDTGDMKAAIVMEEVLPEKYEVTVQKAMELAGEQAYAWFNDAGTVHYQGSNWFTNASIAAWQDLEDADLFEGID